jgi:hypothetical protein
MNERSSHPEVFLSYSMEDTDTAISIAKALEKRGVVVRYDLSLPAGASFGSIVPELISASDYLVLLLSQNTTRWIRDDFDVLLAKQLVARDITIIPVLISDTEIPPLP